MGLAILDELGTFSAVETAMKALDDNDFMLLNILKYATLQYCLIAGHTVLTV
jgi:hypothetical protein